MTFAPSVSTQRLIDWCPVVGVVFAAIGVMLFYALPGPRPSMYAAFGPEDLKLWGAAVAAFISAMCGAAHSVILLVRFIKHRPRKHSHRKKKGDAPKLA